MSVNRFDSLIGRTHGFNCPTFANHFAIKGKKESIGIAGAYEQSATVIVQLCFHYVLDIKNPCCNVVGVSAANEYLHRFAGFAVLKALDVPSVLIEVGFLSNRQDEQALRSKGYRAKLASSIERAIESYFAQIEEAYRK